MIQSKTNTYILSSGLEGPQQYQKQYRWEKHATSNPSQRYSKSRSGAAAWRCWCECWSEASAPGLLPQSFVMGPSPPTESSEWPDAAIHLARRVIPGTRLELS